MTHKNREEYNAYMKNYMLKRYHERMDMARNKLGGKCAWCDETEDLQFDHINKEDKSFIIGSMWSVSLERFLDELDKCQLLCVKHHEEKSIRNQDNVRTEYLKNPQPHGTITKYTYWKCRCDLCKQAMREYKKNRRVVAKR